MTSFHRSAQISLRAFLALLLGTTLSGSVSAQKPTEMKHTPLKDLCYLGGWKDPQTVLRCYQRPDEVTMREALASRRPLEAGEA